ncbi:hypothetical protein EPO15_17480 [bacterium]|nr:MAG: hypothetical protein EPO15_17480 [bacterium]
MGIEDLFYRYKERGVVERDGQKYKKYVKVPLVRTKHKQAAFYAVLALVASVALFAAVRRFADRASSPPEAVE